MTGCAGGDAAAAAADDDDDDDDDDVCVFKSAAADLGRFVTAAAAAASIDAIFSLTISVRYLSLELGLRGRFYNCEPLVK